MIGEASDRGRNPGLNSSLRGGLVLIIGKESPDQVGDYQAGGARVVKSLEPRLTTLTMTIVCLFTTDRGRI